MAWKTKGMNQDLSVSAFNPEFAFENRNLRLSTNEGNTLMSWVNEKGTEEISIIQYGTEDTSIEIKGVPIGAAVINHKLVLFTTGCQTRNGSTLEGTPDTIYLLQYNDAKTVLFCKELYSGYLNFSTESPLETMVSYEAEHIQKVYWTDGRNQPRVINIVEDTSKYTDTSFNFAPNITKFAPTIDVLPEYIPGFKVERASSDGLFAPGVIQYCFTYINKYRQQTNIIDVSPLYYITYNDRGASPEDKVSSSFSIIITNANDSFDYVRIYSIQRTSLNLEPIVKLLIDIPIVNNSGLVENIKYIDNGTTGSLVDPTELLYIGGKEITALTMTDKDGTLFLGNLEEKNTLVDDIQEYFDTVRNTPGHNGTVNYSLSKVLKMEHTTGIYSHTNTLNYSQDKITTFKGGETYRFGFQLQKVTGEWTEPIFLEDKLNELYPKTSVFSDNVNLVDANANINFTVFPDASRFQQFIRVRPVIVYPNQTDRNVLCQGVLNPTVFNVQDRKTSSPFAQASWYFRPYMAHETNTTIPAHDPTDPVSIDSDPISNPPQTASQAADPNGNTHEVYVVVAKTNTLSTVIADGRLHYESRGIETPGIVESYMSSTLEGVVETGELNEYAFIIKEIVPIFEAESGLFINFPGLSNVIYDNTTYQIYNGMYADHGYLRYGGNGTNNSYIFKFFDIKDPTSATARFFTATFASTENYDYSNIDNENSIGAKVEYSHYESLVAQGDTLSAGDEVGIEIQGSKNSYSSVAEADAVEGGDKSNTQFFIDQSIVTLNSPDIEFDTNVQVADTNNLKLRIVGAIPITANVSAHTIATSSSMLETSKTYTREVKTPVFRTLNITVENEEGPSFGSGELANNVLHKNIDLAAGQRLVADYLWNDVEVVGVTTDPADDSKVETKGIKPNYLIHPWHRSGSLNNDSRPSDSASSLLKTKKESNLLFSVNSEYFPAEAGTPYEFDSVGCQMVLTENAQVMNYRLPKQIEKEECINSEVNYYPNVDKILYNNDGYKPIRNSESTLGEAVYTPISMKYKSTSHAVIALNSTDEDEIPILPSGDDAGEYTNEGTSIDTFWGDNITNHQDDLTDSLSYLFNVPNLSDPEDDPHIKFNYLWLGELYKNVDSEVKFGGSSKEALRNNTWCVAGEAKPFGREVTLRWTIGDTYFQRYDCLKTYPFTKEDPNQLVEILSFMCETHVNIDGRYDRNRGQVDNTNMSPINFNLLNPVYSQRDNFFVGKKTSVGDVNSLTYPNQIYYSKTKTSGADVDMWTNVTLASMLELDGDKGELNSLQKFNNQIIAFQDSGISQVLYNENVQLSTTNGVPVEIANSGKVQGKRYISNTIGCSNKWSICNTPSGIYFIDSNNKAIYLFNGQLNNISVQGGMNVWCRSNIPAPDIVWNPTDYEFPLPVKEIGFDNFVAYYDKKNQDVLFIDKNTALAWSEKFAAFTSFYDYGNTPYLCNLDDDTIWIKPYYEIISGQIPQFLKKSKLWKHQAGEYCRFFGENKPYWMTLIGNPEPQMDKIFTNLEFRACVDGDGTTETNDGVTTFKTFYKPFDSLEAWNEYQHGIAALDIKNGHNMALHHLPNSNDASLIRKFRIWRCDIPRDNAAIPDLLGLPRFKRRPMDRMRNPWVYMKLMKNAAQDIPPEQPGGDVTVVTLPKAEIHDVLMTYFE